MLSSDLPAAAVPESLLAHLAEVPDPRVERTKQHQLLDILVIAILAQLCGADSFTEMAQFGRAREAWLRTFLALPHGIPSHDIVNRVFARLDPEAFAASLSSWAQAVADLALKESSPAAGSGATGRSGPQPHQRAGEARTGPPHGSDGSSMGSCPPSPQSSSRLFQLRFGPELTILTNTRVER